MLPVRNPLDVVFIAVAVPLLWFEARARPKTQERLARNDAFRDVGRDPVAVLYTRAS